MRCATSTRIRVAIRPPGHLCPKSGRSRRDMPGGQRRQGSGSVRRRVPSHAQDSAGARVGFAGPYQRVRVDQLRALPLLLRQHDGAIGVLPRGPYHYGSRLQPAWRPDEAWPCSVEGDASLGHPPISPVVCGGGQSSDGECCRGGEGSDRGQPRREGSFLELDEVVALAQACRGPYAELIYVLAMQGGRWGELAGLHDRPQFVGRCPTDRGHHGAWPNEGPDDEDGVLAESPS
jgi:hypothetical protein